jgi:hypothetical protein
MPGPAAHGCVPAKRLPKDPSRPRVKSRTPGYAGAGVRSDALGRSKTPEEEPEAPNIQLECPAEFGNSDIWGSALADPTP